MKIVNNDIGDWLQLDLNPQPLSSVWVQFG